MWNIWLSLAALHSCKEARLSLQFNDTFLFSLTLQDFHILAIAFPAKIRHIESSFSLDSP